MAQGDGCQAYSLSLPFSRIGIAARRPIWIGHVPVPGECIAVFTKRADAMGFRPLFTEPIVHRVTLIELLEQAFQLGRRLPGLVGQPGLSVRTNRSAILLDCGRCRAIRTWMNSYSRRRRSAGRLGGTTDAIRFYHATIPLDDATCTVRNHGRRSVR
jgi:hypothetical protein